MTTMGPIYDPTEKLSNFDFSSVADLGAFWDGSGSEQKGNWGGGTFNVGSAFQGADRAQPHVVSHNVDLIYQNLVGRNADAPGRKYWVDKLTKSGENYDVLIDSLKAGKEYRGQQSEIQKNPNVTAAELKSLSSAHVNKYSADSGSAFAGWEPGDAITGAMANESAADAAANNRTLSATGYTGAQGRTYSSGLADPDLRWDKGSKFDRSYENIYQQSQIDEIIKYVQESGLGGNFNTLQSKWTPSLDRDQGNRLTEDIWQQGQIEDLEKWVAGIIGSDNTGGLQITGQDGEVVTNPYAGLTFNPSEKFGDFDSIHTNVNMDRNRAQASSIDNLLDFISRFDTARGPDLQAERDRMSGIYGTEIDNIYNRLFETDTGIDSVGKAYWTNDLLDNRAGLQVGQNWQQWLEDAFKNTDSYKDFLASKPPARIEPPDLTELPRGGGGSDLTDYSQQLQNEQDSWDIRFNDLTSMYTDQINDLKATFEQSNRDQAALFQGYQDQVAGYRADLNAQAAYGERPMNQTVRGVKTRNELPGFKPSTGGTTGHFNRTGNRITNSSLNIA